MAARAQRPAAPVIPGEPATISTAELHLWSFRRRAGSNSATSASSISWSSAWPTGRPMSATETRPASSTPSPWSRPGLRAAKVTVRSAGSGVPAASPVSPSTPDGMSTASTGVPAAKDGARYSPRNPVP